MARKPTTNNGTKGGLRAPYTAVSLRRRQRLTPATNGASNTTRVNLTTTAAASAVGPTTDAVATVCATSCTLAPVHVPNSTSDSPSGCCSNGSTTIARLPNRVTSTIAVTTSSSSFLVTPSMAATADAPQIEKPVATSSEVPGLTPIQRPSN